MNNALKFGLLATGLGFAMNATTARATVVYHEFDSNAVNYCQAFTPGPTNTIRNRVVGAENVGTAAINVACNFNSMYGTSSTNPEQVSAFFSNHSSTPITISCTLLTGYEGESDGGQYAVTKTLPLAANETNSLTTVLTWDHTDNPDATATDLGTALVGINCTLPPGAVINDTYLGWDQEDGVGI